VYWISRIYVAIIAIVVGGMLLHNLLDFVKKGRLRIRQRTLGGGAHAPGRAYVRMTKSERIQHAILLSSFALLALTGFMLRYPDAGWVRWLRSQTDGAFDWR